MIATPLLRLLRKITAYDHAEAEIWTIVYQRIASAAIITMPITIRYAAPRDGLHNTLSG